MSETVSQTLKESVMESRAAQDVATASIQSLENKRNQLWNTRKIDWKTNMRLSELILRIDKLIAENNLNKDFDEIVSTANVLSAVPYFALDEVMRGHDLTDILEVLRTLGISLNSLFEKPLPSVAVGTEQDPEKRSKPIDNILYSYTPFKMRGVAGNYRILLLPSRRKSNITTKWCNDDSKPFFEGDTKILTPNSIWLTNVNDLKSLASVDGERGFRLEIDRRSPSKTYYCRMGLYISPVSQCQRRECYLWEPCQGKKFWKGPTSIRSLSKVSPDIVVKIDRYDNPDVIQTNRLNISVETIKSLQAKIYIDSVIFYSSYFTQSPIIKLRETPGYRVTTKSMAFSIDGPSIENFVQAVLTNDPEIFSWIFTKYFVKSSYDVNDLKGVSAFFWNLVSNKKDTRTTEYEKKIKVREVTTEIVQFGVSLLMHSLAHLIHEEVISMLQTSPQNLVYYFSTKPEPDGKYRIFIIENAEKGLGLTQSFAATVAKAGPRYLEDFAERLNKIVALDSRTPLSYSAPTEASADVKLIWDRVNEYHRNFQVKFGVSVPVEFVRYMLNRYDSRTMNIIQKDEVSPYVDDILSSTPLCWDGCYHCVRLESDCHDSPYEQVFTVSKSLLLAFLNEWLGTFKPKHHGGENAKPIVQIGEAKELLTYIRGARNEVAIISPWFSKQVAKTICDLSRSQGVKFKILTSNDENNETHVEALRIFGAEQDQHVDIRVLTDRLPHIKMIIVDDALLIMGSANLTLSGLYENVEGYVIIDDTDNITRSLRSFAELWNQGKEVN